MNKIQLIKLLQLRGIKNINNNITTEIKKSGGQPSNEEMTKVNKHAMEYYIDKYQETLNQLDKTQVILNKTFDKLDNIQNWLQALEKAGLNKWEGIKRARKIQNENK